MSGFFSSNVTSRDTAPLYFVVQPSRNLICLICQQVFEDPVISECGHTFCRRCITTSQAARCPVHIERSLTVVVDNLAVQEQINELLVKCRFGLIYSTELHTWINDDNGCQAVIKVSEKLSHESQCEFRLVQCPNCADATLIRRKDFQQHLNECRSFRCIYEQYGCKFVGNEEQFQTHVSTDCKFEPFKEFIRSTEERLQEQSEQLQMKDQEINFLRSLVTKLADKVDDLDRKLEGLHESSARAELDIVDLRRDVDELSDDVHQVSSLIPQNSAAIFVGDDKTELKCIGTFIGHDGPVWCLVGHGDFVFSGSTDTTIKVWDVSSSFECVKTLEGHDGIVLCLCIYENRLYSGASDSCFNVWSLDTFSLIKRTHAHNHAVCAMAISEDGVLLTGSLKSIKAWSIRNNNCNLIKEFESLQHWVRALCVSERLLYAGSYQAVLVWSLDSYECLKTLELNGGGNVYSLCLFENILYAAASENSIHEIDLNADKVTNTLKGHEGTVYCITIFKKENCSPLLLSSSYDKSLKVWSLNTNSCLQTLIRHHGSVSCLLVHNNRVYSGAVDSGIKVWC